MHATALPDALARRIQGCPFPVALAVVTPQLTWAGGDLATVYPWMSVTKLVTSRIVLRAVEDGLIDLDDPLGPQGSTVEMVLAHASGLGPEGDVQAAPGTRRIYSNAGYELLGQLVEQVRGQQFSQLVAGYMEQLGPDAHFEGSPAWGMSSRLLALATLASEMLEPRLIDPALWRLATRPAWPGLPGIVPGYGSFDDDQWGLGPEIRAHKHPHWTAPDAAPGVYGHFGQSGSFLWVDAEAQVGACFLSSRRFGLAHQRLWPDLNAEIQRMFIG
ncbi:MAG: serine hydrolase domain-containing protein [Actinomycetaceae bacterium]|nr:serine hydrolase domain-containing protein [Actinomycetaceae bacterium]MDU0969814.1 serine hydrolase domain-containing protein [Actinomycetaceae bacterium]